MGSQRSSPPSLAMALQCQEERESNVAFTREGEGLELNVRWQTDCWIGGKTRFPCLCQAFLTAPGPSTVTVTGTKSR